MNKILLGLDLVKSMGFKPVAYRVVHTFKKKTGLLKKAFPTLPSNKNFITLEEWKKLPVKFFFNSREELKQFYLKETEKETLHQEFLKIKEGYLKFFSGEYKFIGKDYDWITHPETKHKFDLSKHWSEIESLDANAGDIKYVWEKSRFSYLYTLIRFDYHFKEDQSEYVFSEILSWINKNPLNMGPNYNCSQEISIRILNWIFALNYYKNSSALTEERFKKIINSIYDQARHVEEHINFSLLTVRNNHAITECLLLYTVGLLFPFFEESKRWKDKGKSFLEQEGLYQIYEDGSYLQFSMNYERVIIQLFTWAFSLAKVNEETFSDALKERIGKAINFLYQCQDESTGMLPNYGANDGALFFPLNNHSFRDYRPQLNAAHYILFDKSIYPNASENEDIFWFTNKVDTSYELIERKISSFIKGGYYVLRDIDKFSFIRCGSHRDRPSQADNLHLDIWYQGNNILRDAGSYKYNSSKEDIKYFMGTSSHNTVMIDDQDQMLKGGRFLWFFWSKTQGTKLSEDNEAIYFSGTIHAFRHLDKHIVHERSVKQFKKETKWEIEDKIIGIHKPMKQIWNVSSFFLENNFEITCTDIKGNEIKPIIKDAFYSPTYGVKENSKQIIFETEKRYFKTTISKNKS